MKRSRADLILLLLVVAAFAAGNIWLARRGTEEASVLELAPDASAFNRGPSGLYGLYRLWGELGKDSRVWRHSWKALPEDAGLLVVAAPFGVGPQAGRDEPPLLLRWVKKGHALLIIGGEPALLSACGLRLRPGPEARRALSPSAPTDLMTGVSALHVSGDRWRSAPPPAVIHIADGGGPALVSWPLGRGRVIALVDSGALANAHLAARDNAILAANIASLGTGAIYFDEYHHGHRSQPTLASLLLRPPLLWVTLQVLFALAVFLHAASRRFGPPVPAQDTPRYRASGEYVAAMAGLYQRAASRAVVLRRLAQGFRREVSRALGLPPDLPARQLAEAAARRCGADADRIARVLSLCEEQVTPTARPNATSSASGGLRGTRESLVLWAGSELETLRRQALGR